MKTYTRIIKWTFNKKAKPFLMPQRDYKPSVKEPPFRNSNRCSHHITVHTKKGPSGKEVDGLDKLGPPEYIDRKTFEILWHFLRIESHTPRRSSPIQGGLLHTDKLLPTDDITQIEWDTITSVKRNLITSKETETPANIPEVPSLLIPH